jgi:replicative DNA helicase
MPEGQMVEKITAQKGRISPNLFYPDMTKDDYGYRGLEQRSAKATASWVR